MAQYIEKGWGHEEVIANESGYCGKLLVFNPGGKLSMHFHILKHETWYVQDGRFFFRWINPIDARRMETVLEKGSILTNKPGAVHQLEAGPEGGMIFEVSTTDYPTDSYRVEKGDSQK